MFFFWEIVSFGGLGFRLNLGKVSVTWKGKSSDIDVFSLFVVWSCVGLFGLVVSRFRLFLFILCFLVSFFFV